MSLILEALNRSQHERKADVDTPDLDTPVYLERDVSERRWLSYLPWLALVAALLLIALLLMDKFASDNYRSSADPVKSAPVQPVQVPQPITVPPKVTQPATELQPSPVNASPIEPEQNAAPPAPVVVDQPNAAPAPAVDTAAVAALYGGSNEEQPEVEAEVEGSKEAAAEVTAVQGVDDEQLIDIEDVLARSRQALKNKQLVEHPAPFISELSQQTKDDIPSILYSQHDYASVAKQSSVVLNGKKVQAGGSVTGSIKLDEILPDSIVLSYRGTQFRLRALNSWVNL